MDSFPPLRSIFYAEFDPVQGPIVVYQVPEGFVKSTGVPHSALTTSLSALDTAVTSPTDVSPAFFSPIHTMLSQSRLSSTTGGAGDDKDDNAKLDFDAISEYIIPKPELCGRLVTLYADDYKIMGLPVLIEDSKLYERNNFLFNLCFVFDKNASTTCYNQVIQKIAREFRNMEVYTCLQSRPQSKF